MVCLICETNKISVSLIQQQVKSLQERNIQLGKINDTLLKTLKGCSANQNWKTKYEVLLGKTLQMQSLMNVLPSKQKAQNCRFSEACQYGKSSNQTQKLSGRQSFRLSQMEGTPKNRKDNYHSQKMIRFMSTLKKNKSIKFYNNVPADQNVPINKKVQIRTPEKKLQKRIKDPFFGQMGTNKTSRFKYQNKKIDIPERCQYLIDKDQGLNYRNIKTSNKPKTFVQMLAFF